MDGFIYKATVEGVREEECSTLFDTIIKVKLNPVNCTLEEFAGLYSRWFSCSSMHGGEMVFPFDAPRVKVGDIIEFSGKEAFEQLIADRVRHLDVGISSALIALNIKTDRLLEDAYKGFLGERSPGFLG